MGSSRPSIDTPPSDWDRMLSGDVQLAFSPLDCNPCAGNIIVTGRVCPNPGTMACSACKIVSYCSKDCQRRHWKAHKKDCNHIIRTDEWRPAWEEEHRSPSFITPTESDLDVPDSPLSLGMTLWGNTPAVDLINFKSNENNIEKDFNLAFVASGDLRHAMKTINSLPLEYNGQLRLLINDHNPVVTSRNIVLLLILSQIPDEEVAADVALHFWYSALMPYEYKTMIAAAVERWIAVPNDEEFRLGPKSSMSTRDIGDLGYYLSYMTRFENDEVERARSEYFYVRAHPSRQDLRDRMYSYLQPSHRLAFNKYRSHGIILPFGAMNKHFNARNGSLFSIKGAWLQNDYADPLKGWEQVSGKARGAHEEDIYGCFYFFISDHLKTLWRRIRTFKMTFIMTKTESRALANAVKASKFQVLGMSRSSGFDRIHVSNILDANYVGLQGVLDAWAPLLSVSQSAVLVGYFMNWVGSQRGGRVADLPEKEIFRLFKRMKDEGKAKFPIGKVASGMTMRPSTDFQIALFFMMSNADFIYDNSDQFLSYLGKQGLDTSLKRHGLKLRKKHTIVPPRIGASIGSALNDLPHFDQEGSWYYQSSMLSSTGFERFVEFSCI